MSAAPEPDAPGQLSDPGAAVREKRESAARLHRLADVAQTMQQAITVLAYSLSTGEADRIKHVANSMPGLAALAGEFAAAFKQEAARQEAEARAMANNQSHLH